MLEQLLERLPSGSRLDEIFSKAGEDSLVTEQLGRLTIDQQDVDLVIGGHRCPSPLSNSFSLSRWPWSPMQPHTQRRQELLGVDGLGKIVGGTGLQALLAVALHGLGRECDDGQPVEAGL